MKLDLQACAGRGDRPARLDLPTSSAAFKGRQGFLAGRDASSLADRIPWPCELDSDIRQAVARCATVVRVEPHHPMRFRHDGEHGLFCIESGVVIVGSIGASPLTPLTAGDWFGGSRVYNDRGPMDFRIIAIESAKLYSFSTKPFQACVNAYPELYKLLYMVTSARSRELVDLLYISLDARLPRRVAYVLLECMRHLRQVQGATPMISVPQTQLALICGISRPKLNQQLHQLQAEGYIQILGKRIFLTDTNALRVIAGCTADDGQDGT